MKDDFLFFNEWYIGKMMDNHIDQMRISQSYLFRGFEKVTVFTVASTFPSALPDETPWFLRNQSARL